MAEERPPPPPSAQQPTARPRQHGAAAPAGNGYPADATHAGPTRRADGDLGADGAVGASGGDGHLAPDATQPTEGRDLHGDVSTRAASGYHASDGYLGADDTEVTEGRELVSTRAGNGYHASDGYLSADGAHSKEGSEHDGDVSARAGNGYHASDGYLVADDTEATGGREVDGELNTRDADAYGDSFGDEAKSFLPAEAREVEMAVFSNGRRVAGEKTLPEEFFDAEAGAEAGAAWEAGADTLCGLGAWRPPWLQRLASKKVYVLIHGLIGLHQFYTGAYFVATISTLEKRFKIPSRTSGVISAAWDVGQCVSVLFMGYLGRQGHKPRLVASGVFILACACFVRLLPHLLYGPGHDALALTREHGGEWALNANSSGAEERGSLCGAVGGAGEAEDCSGGGSMGAPAVIFFCSGLLLGVGSSVYWTLGVAYLDDNTHKDKAPLTLAATSCIRLLGPTIGFSVASYALARYVDLSVTPLIQPDDPRWIGAWWIGYCPAVALGLVLAALMALFPRQLPRTAQRRALRAPPPPPPPPSAAPASAGTLHRRPPPAERQRSVRDFGCALKRLLRNRVLLFNTFSGVCFMFGLIGYWTFMPKYMETQYRQSASTASLISGSVGILFSGVGIAASAVVIHKWKPRARTLAAWSVAVEAVDVLGHVSWAFLDCGAQDLHGSVGVGVAEGAWNLTATCNAQCGCGDGGGVKYEPVCSLAAATTFYSPCHAGCPSPPSVLNGTTMFSECACSPDGLVVEGACPRDCAFNFAVFLATQCVMRLLGSSGKAGNTLIQFRCVHEDDKSLALAFGEFLLCVFAFMPGPIVYGMLLDSACLVWGEMCGQTGNCWLYEDKKLRYLLNFTAGFWLFCGMTLDIAVWYFCKDLKIYDDDDDTKDEKRIKKPDEDETPFIEKT